MKSHIKLKDGTVKLNIPFYMDNCDLAGQKWIQKSDGDFTIHEYDENQKEYYANALISVISSLIDKNLDEITKIAQTYIGKRNIVREG
jgi:hypothetical protein